MVIAIAENALARILLMQCVVNDSLKILYVGSPSFGSEAVLSALGGADTLGGEDTAYRVTEVASQTEAEATLRSGDYSLVLCDLTSAAISCLEFLDFIRTHYPRLPVIIIAASGSEEIAVECMKRGAADYVFKLPHYLQKLPHAIEAALERSRLRTERERMTQQLAYQAQLLASVNDAIIATDEKFILTAWNPGAERMYGWKATEVIGRPVQDVVGFVLAEEERAKAYSSLASEGQCRLELQQHRRDGTAIFTESNAIALRDGAGRISSYVTVIRDITDRKQAEEKLRQSEKRYKHIAENVPGVVYQWLHHPDGSMEWPFVSEGSYRIFGVAAEFIQQNPTWPLDAVHPGDQFGLTHSIAEAVATLEPWYWEGRLVLPDGDIRWVQDTSRLQRQENGDVLADGLFLDITERKQNEEQSQFKSHLLNTVGQAVIATDLQGHITYWNRAAQEIFGWSDREVMGRNIVGITVPQTTQEQAAEIIDQLKEGQVWSGEFLVQRRDGTTFPALVTDAPVLDAQGKLIGIIGVATDISERKQMEQALQKSRQDMVDIFESITEAFYALNREWKFTYVNAAGYQLHNREPGSLLGKNLWEALPQAVGTVFQEQYEKAMRERVTISFEEYYAPLDTWAEVRVYPFEDGISVYIRDVTERRRNEAMLREMESRFRRLADANIIGVAVSGVDGVIYEANDFLLNLLGYSRQEFQENPLRWKAITPPEYAPRDAKAIADFVNIGSIIPFEKEYFRKDGSRVSVLLSGTVLDKSSNRGLFLVLDLTWQKRAEKELKLYAEKLERSNRELQEFAFIASHDLQEPLRKIEAFSERLQEDYSSELGDDGLDYLQRMQSAVQRMRAFITDLLTLSRVETRRQPMAPVDLAQIAGEVLSDLETQITETGANVEIDSLDTIEADPLQMRQLLQNLIGNALKFRRADRAPLIRVQGQMISRPTDSAIPLYQISVADNGIGFDQKHLDRIFQPFVRLHGRSQYEGTGMGLALCRKIAERHGGSITAEGTLQGSTFIVTLPVKQAPQP